MEQDLINNNLGNTIIELNEENNKLQQDSINNNLVNTVILLVN